MLFKRKNKPTQPVDPEYIPIEYDGVVVELPKLGSMTYAETQQFSEFIERVKREKFSRLGLLKEYEEFRIISLEQNPSKKQKERIKVLSELLEMQAFNPSLLNNSRWIAVMTLGLNEIRQATIEPDYKQDFSMAMNAALDENTRLDRIGVLDENGDHVPLELIEKMWTEFWSYEYFGSWEKPLNEPEGKAPEGEQQTGTKSS